MPSSLSSLLKISRLAALAALVLASASALAAPPSVSARFDPAQLSVGQTGTYKLAFHNTSGSAQGNVPLIPDLKFQYVSQGLNQYDNNGVVTSTFEYVFQVQSDKIGNYTIPAFKLVVDGKTVTVPSATLVVTDQPTGSTIGSQPITLTTKVPSTQVYVGQKFPLDLTLAVRDDLRLIGLGGLTQNGDAFEQAQSNMRQDSDDSTFQQDDHSFDAHSWHTAITALTSGPQTLRFSMPVAVMRMGNPFGGQTDDLIARMFGNSGLGFGQQQQLNVDSTPLTFDVQPLPADGRPGNFTGGIGLFDLTDPSLSSTALQVGVPITLTLTVSGQGNFDRLHAPVIDTGALWRSYKPKETFTPDPSDPTGYHGTKTFEYVLMPLSQNITTLPPPQFNFFNPDTKTYVDLTPKPIPVTVQAAAPGQSVPLPAVSNNVAAAAPTLVGPRTEPGTWVSPSLAPIFYSPYFLGAQAAPAILLATLVITRRRRLRLETDPAYARQLRAHRSALAAVAKARAAAAAGLAAEFYATAQRALQEAASHSAGWRQDSSAEALTWPEFDAHLTARGVPSEVHAAAREIFEAGDALRFGGFTPDQSVLAEAANRLDGVVRQLLRA